MMDWRKLIEDLIRAGLHEAQIGRRIGTSRQAVNNLKMRKSKEPRYSPGTKLVALHESYVREGFIHDRAKANQLGAVLEGGIAQAGNSVTRRALQSA